MKKLVAMSTVINFVWYVEAVIDESGKNVEIIKHDRLHLGRDREAVEELERIAEFSDFRITENPAQGESRIGLLYGMQRAELSEVSSLPIRRISFLTKD